jgi:hypothetical protein
LYRRGFKKGIERLPALIKESTGRIQETPDPEYDYLAKRFYEFQSSAQALHKNATAYKGAVQGKFSIL